MLKKKTQGGKRKGAGAKLKYGEATTPVVTRVPLSKVKDFRLFVNLKLKDWLSSGTTGVACKKTGRNFIGIEMDEKYFITAKNRI